MDHTPCIYDCLAMDGASPMLHIRGNAPPPLSAGTIQAAPAGREANPIAAQMHQITALLLRHIPESRRENMGLFTGTRYGCIEDDRMFQKSRMDDGGKYVSPAAFRRTLPSTAPAELSIAHGIRGPLIVFADTGAPAALAMTRAARWISSGKISSALAGSFDYLTGHNGVCRTILCLMATRDTLPDLQPWAIVTNATLQFAPSATPQTTSSDFEQLTAAMTAENFSSLNLQCPPASGLIRHLVLKRC